MSRPSQRNLNGAICRDDHRISVGSASGSLDALQHLCCGAGEGTADYDTDDELIDADVIGPHLAEIGLEFEWLAGGQPMPPWIAHPPQPPQQQQAPADGED